jgi:alginate O-acetyltransferase complex protein AlgI
MVFSSITFLFAFLTLVLIVYALCPNKLRNYVLLVASILFYAWGAPRFVFVLLASTIIDFFMVQTMHRTVDKSLKKKWLAASIFLNLGLLIYFKYANFFVENLNEALLALGFQSAAWVKVALPIGISFYTFQTLTYSLDVYRGTHKPLKRVTDYLLYITMFPQLIAGPIVRFHAIADQLRERIWSSQNVVEGFIRFSVGLGKKVLIADVLALVADDVFDHGMADLSAPTAWLGLLCYTFQIYFDFSGYSDMAIGLGRMFGFTFPENFNSPYVSKSITEFWRRWHITLGTFMRDYLYIPLGGNKISWKRTYFNLWIVFVLSGLWHGDSWTFVVWGVFHGGLLITERVSGWSKRSVSDWVKIPISFILVALAWVVFRAETMHQAGVFYKALFSFKGKIPIQIYNHKLLIVLCLAAIFSFLPMFKVGQKWVEHFYEKSHSATSLMVYFGIALFLFVLSTAYLSTGNFNSFIYFRF